MVNLPRCDTRGSLVKLRRAAAFWLVAVFALALSYGAAQAQAPTLARADIPANTLGAGETIIVSGYAAPGDMGAGAVYSSDSACQSSHSSPAQLALQDHAGTWFCLLTNGEVNAGWFGAKCDGVSDDTAALQAAIATKLAVVVSAPIGTPNSANCEVSSTIDVNNFEQNWTQNNAIIAPLPGFTGQVVLRFSNNSQTINNAYCDGGAANSTPLNLVCMQNAGSGSIFFRPQGTHFNIIGFDLEAGARVYDLNFWQWLPSETQFATDANFTATVLEVNAVDSHFYQPSPHWGRVQIYLDCGSGTDTFIGAHPYSGRPGGPPQNNFENIHVAACAGGSNNFDNLYDDEGQVNLYGRFVSIRGAWPLTNSGVSTFSNGYINVVATGQKGLPSDYDIRSYTSAGALYSGLNYINFIDNSNSIPITSVSGDGTTATAILGGPRFTGSIATVNNATVLTVSGLSGGNLTGHRLISGTGVPKNTAVQYQLTGLTGMNGTYVLTAPPTSVSSEAMTAVWTADVLPPLNLTTINVQGVSNAGYDCGPTPTCFVSSATAISLLYFNHTIPPSTGGNFSETWNGDWSGVPAMQPDNTNYSIENGNRLIFQTDVNKPFQWVYQGYPGAGNCIDSKYEVGSAAPFHICYNNTGWTAGAGASIATSYCLGDETSPACLDEDGAQGLSINQGGAETWTFAANGTFRPTANGATSPVPAIGNGAHIVADVYSEGYRLGGNKWAVGTPPSARSGFGTGAVANGTSADFRLNVGTGTITTPGVLTMPFIAQDHWDCDFRYFNPNAAELLLTTEVTAEGPATAAINATGNSYTPGTGLVILALGTSPGLVAGQQFSISSASGTGSFASINGTQTAISGSSGTTLKFTIAPSLAMTITGGTVTYGTVTLASYTRSSGAATPWPASAPLMGRCGAY